MRSALWLLVLAGAAAAQGVPPVKDEERRAEDNRLRGGQAAPEYGDAVRRWEQSRGAAGGDRAMRERLDRILREETTRDATPPPPREKRVEKRADEKPVEDQERDARPASSSGGGVPVSVIGNLMWAVLILLAAAVLAFAIYAITMAVLNSRRRPPAAGESVESTPEEERGGAAPPILRDPEEWLAEARRLAAAGQWLQALRCLLFASLERLHRSRFIDYTRARTNRECVRAFAGPEERRAPFRALVDEFDVAVYGGRAFGAAEYARAEAAARALGKEEGHEGHA